MTAKILETPHFRQGKSETQNGVVTAADGSAGLLLLRHIADASGGREELDVSAFIGITDAALFNFTLPADQRYIVVDIPIGWHVNNAAGLLAAFIAQYPEKLPPPIIHGKP